MIVSNATPLISFARIGQLDLMRRVVGETVVIPEAVAAEILDAPPASRGSIDLAAEPWVRVERVRSRQQVELLLPSLDLGEAEVIALALERRARLVLIDEFTGRKVADVRVEPRRRAEAGKVLAALGDPRPEVMTLEGLWMGLCQVPAGAFWMGSEKGAQWGYATEHPYHQVEIPYPYRLSRFPVTVAQFREYVESSEVAPGHPASVEEPANGPVVAVSWYEALAFCRWLTERWRGEGLLMEGEEVTLPSEAEWEKGARGGDGRVFPWGGEEDPNRMNNARTGIGEVSAVGCFPGGVSPYGCEEMLGNMWEWTRSLWGERDEPSYAYPYQRADGREDLGAGSRVRRVVRGGSFVNYVNYARSAARPESDPSVHYNFFGFRVVVLRPVSSRF